MEFRTTLDTDTLNLLGAPFPQDEIEFLPRASSGGMALGLPYIDARSVMRRLDAVVGPCGWSYDFDLLAADGKMVKGRLTILGVTKCDAGESAAEDEPLKSAVSDALKRAAVHFGIGRYLYHLPRIWAPFDPQKRRFIEAPRLDPAAVQKALQIAGIVADVPDFRPGPRPDTRPPQAPRPDTRSTAPAESRGDARAQQALERSEKPLPVAGGNVEELVCSVDRCGTSLTKGQRDVSMRAFGRALCPAHQKTANRLEAS